MRIKITPYETNAPVSLHFTLIARDGTKVAVRGKYYIEEARGKQRQEVNVMNDYHTLYAMEEAKRTAFAVGVPESSPND